MVARENFVTKHCNIISQGVGTETYIDTKYVRACKVASIDWEGRVVYLGVDLSEINDNTLVSMATVGKDNNILADSFAFISGGRISEKRVNKKVNYLELLGTKKVIDYAVVEEKYGVQIQAIGYDRLNALNTI